MSARDLLPQPPRLRIRRLHSHYLLPAAHPSPERVRSRLDESALHGLAGALESHLARGFSGPDEGLWLIRRLEVSVDLNAAWDRDAAARAWALQIAAALGRTLRDGEDGQNVLWFPSRAAYLARFLAETAEGHAGERWYYEHFAGLRLLPTSACLRTALLESPPMGQAALLQLAPQELRSVVRSLTVQDARRVVDRLAEASEPGDEVRCLETVWDAFRTAEGDPLLVEDESRAVLRLYLGACLESVEVGGLPLRAAARALARLHRRLTAGSEGQREALLGALADGSLAGLYAAVGSEAEVLAPFLACPPEWVREVAQALLGRTADPAEAGSEPEARYTHFGGIFLLLPMLATMPLEEGAHDWPPAEGVPAAGVLRLLLAVKSCGGERAAAAWQDPVVRDLVGVPPGLTLEALRRWARRVRPLQVAELLRAHHGWLAEQGALGGETLLLAQARARGGPAALLLEGARGVWLALLRARQVPESLAGALGEVSEAAAGASPLLLTVPELLEAAAAALPGQRAALLDSEEARSRAAGHPALAETLARLGRLEEDLGYLSLPPSFGLPGALDCALSVAAQGLLRAFAWRLPGFAGSSLPYLYRNFLDARARLEEQPARRVVELGRPPLHLILALTGMDRASYRLEWLDERPLALFPAG